MWERSILFVLVIATYSANAESTEPLTNPNIPSRTSCGFQEYNRILNGENADMEEFPWMALLVFKDSLGIKRLSCGGTLISSKYILTAAHCINIPELGKLFAVRLGEWNTDTDIDCITVSGKEICNEPPVDIEVESSEVHNGYNETTATDDIALIRLKNPVTYRNNIRPICLPLRTEMSTTGDYLTVAGWGRTQNSSRSAIKQKLRVPFANKSECTRTFTKKGLHLTDKQLCAGGEAGKDSCQGDSGGPLVRTSPSDITQWYIEGVVSFGIGCGKAGWPGVYTKVTSYLDWINSNVKA